MLCLNGSSPWSGFTIAAMLTTVCVLLVHDVESYMPDVHMGILETGQDIQKEEKSNTVKLPMKPDETECERYQRFQCSYALSALRHLQFTKRFLYNSDGELMSVTDFKDMSFDTEAVLMLATLDCGPYRDALYNGLWALWFYTVRLRQLLDAFFKPTHWRFLAKRSATEKPKDNYMFEVHQSVEESLRSFVELYTSKLGDAEEKLNEINGQEQTSSGGQKLFERNLISANKQLLNRQIAANKLLGVSPDGAPRISFKRITLLHKWKGIKRIVAKYLGKKYWAGVKLKLRKMYATATSLDVTLGLQIALLWHTKNGIVKMLKLILVQFLESYLDFASSTKKTFEEIKQLDETVVTMLKGFNESVGQEDKVESVVQMFRKRRVDHGSKFNEMVKKRITAEIQYYPKFAVVNNTAPHGDYISDYYKLLTEYFTGERKTEMSDACRSWENMYSYVEKVKRLFSDSSSSVSHTFDYFVFTKPFQSMENLQPKANDDLWSKSFL